MRILVAGVIAMFVCVYSASARWMQDAGSIRSQSFETSDGVRLHYLEAGSGPALVFLPGWICPTWIWEPQIRHFSKSYRVVALDPRSQGESEQVSEGLYPERRARDIKELIDRLKLAPAVLVGHSMAVIELLAFVDQFGTGGVAGLGLVDASIAPPPDAVAVEQFTAMVKLLTTDRQSIGERIRPGFFKKPLPPGYFERLIEATTVTPTDTAVALLAAAFARDFRPALAKIDKPVFYLITPPLKAQGEALKAAVPTARVEVFDDAGHVLFVDEPARFNALIEELARTAFDR